MKYRIEILVNEYSTPYGVEYIISEKGEREELISKLIEDIIGEEYYYSSRDVWNQIHISFE